MTSYEPQNQGSPWGYPPAGTSAGAPRGPRHAYAPPASGTPSTSYYRPASAYPSPSSIYRPRFGPNSALRPPQPKNGNRWKLFLAMASVLLVIGVAVGGVLHIVSGKAHAAKSAKDAKFVAFIHDSIPGSAKTPDAEIVKLGHAVCTVLKANPGLKAASGALIGSGYTGVAGGYYLVESIKVYCPQFSYLGPRAV
jgi:hypothetical protein